MHRSRQAGGTSRAPTNHPVTTATLSIVMVAAGSNDARVRACRALLDSSAPFDAQVIVVARGEPDSALLALANRGGAEVVRAPDGSTRAEMCDLGMKQVTGSIVAVRDDVDVGDASWLAAFSRIVPMQSPAPRVERELAVAVGAERVLMDSMAPGRAHRGDAAPVRQPLADLPLVPAPLVEMAATM